MHYRNIKSVLLFQEVNDHQYTIDDFSDPPNGEQAYFRPSGTNLYVEIGAMLDRISLQKPALTPQHIAVIRDVQDNVQNGIVSLSFEPSTGATPDDCHALVINNPEGIRQFFSELANLFALGNGVRIYVRYAGEFNSFGDANDIYAGSPEGYHKAIQIVNVARNIVLAETGKKIDLTFCPTINPACGNFDGPGNLLKCIHPYWPDNGRDIFDAYTCTWYCRPQPELNDPEQVLDLVFERFRVYAERMGLPLGFDEIGGSMITEANRLSGSKVRNDEMLEKMLNRLGELGGTIEFATIFLQEKWGADATLDFMVGTGA